MDANAGSGGSRTVTAGALYRRDVRRELERLKFLGHQIEWIEQKGFLENTFIIKAPARVLEAIDRAVDALEEEG